MGSKCSSFEEELRAYEESRPGLKSVLSAVGGFLTVESAYKEREDRLALRYLPTAEEIAAGLVNGQFVLKDKELEVDQEHFSRVFGENLKVLADFHPIPEEVGPLAERIKKSVGRLHQLDSRDVGNLATGPEFLPGIVQLILLYYTARPFYVSFADHVRQVGGLKGWTAGYCPVCGQPPFMARLEEEDGARYLECGLCSTTWRFPRLACPFCDSLERPKTRYFYVPGDEGRRVYVCEDCKTYLKSIDIVKLGRRPLLLIEFIATPNLDFLAQRSGYIAPDNLISALIFTSQQDIPAN